MKRVLFVDDEQRILQGLKRTLRCMRGEWEMVFVDSGEAALEVLAGAKFDVVISDMRMPRMDGAALLERVCKDYPDTVRMILSGYSEAEAAIRAVPFAHQFLAKPCPADQLREVVTRALQLHQLHRDETLREVVGKVQALPARPDVYSALTRQLQDPKTGLGELADTVQHDVAICAKILQLVNSAFFGLPRRVTDMRAAVNYLGTSTLKALVLSLEASAALGSEGPGSEVSLLGAQLTTKMLDDKITKDDAFTAALIPDIGELVLDQQRPEHLTQARELAAAEGIPIVDAERALFGATHAEVGAYLLGLWGLPYPVVEAVAYHHDPQRCPHQSFGVVDAVHIALELAHAVLTGGDAAVDEAYLASLGVADRIPQWRAAAAAMSKAAAAA